MTIDPAIDIVAFDAYVVGVLTAVSPPFGRAEESDDGRSGGNGNVRRAGVAADVNARAFCQFIKTF